MKPSRPPQLLQLVPYEHSVLRMPTEQIEFPLSQEDFDSIHDMIYSIQPEQLMAANAPFHAAAGMAANQWGINKRIFIYYSESQNNQLQVILNPSYEVIDEKDELVSAWEGCFSIPLSLGEISRHQKIKVTYQDLKGQTHNKTLEGWEARIWQHETDHLSGSLYDDPKLGKCSHKQSFQTNTELQNFRKSN